MSASLVGSEMCIRDRTAFGPPQQPPAEPERVRVGGRSSGEARGPGGSAAVSYTHLTLPTICSV
eukprot:14088974-Alexandrium_andersonii.AAC.1